MNNKTLLAVLVTFLAGVRVPAQAPSGPSASAVWKALSSPVMDAEKFARVENVEFARDRVHFRLLDGTIQFAQPVNGVVCAAVFHGNGRVAADPPNPIEAQQLQLFLKEPKMNMAFADATFTFTDGLMEEVAKQVKWSTGSASDELYAKRQQAREDLGAASLPRLFQSVLSGDAKRTAYFLADMKTKDGDWFEVIDDATQPEEIWIGRWSDVGPLKIQDVWMQFSAGGRDPRHAYDDQVSRLSYLIPGYKIDAVVAENADLNATTRVTVEPRYSGDRALLFSLDSNMRLQSVKDAQGHALEFFQARETKDRYQSYGDYVAVALAQPTQAGHAETYQFQYGGKRAVRRVGDGNYFCESFGWYPTLLTSRFGVEPFAFRSDFELDFHIPKHYSLVATGHKVSEDTAGNSLLTSWKSDIPLAVAGFAFGDYKLYAEKAGETNIQVYANKQPDDFQKSIQNLFDPDSRAPGDINRSHASYGPVGNMTPAALAKTIGGETANTLRLFESYYGPYPYKQLAVTNISGFYGQGWPGLLYLSWLTFLDSTQRNALGIKQQTQLTDFFRAHESSHQWWGHRVGWKSYHDQWLSEGFAEFSGMLYVLVRQGPKEFKSQMQMERDNLRARDIKDHAVESLGPIWMGRRILSSQTSPSSYQKLIYSKGGFVLQMLRMQLFDARNPDPDHLFREMMQDYCKTFDNKAASTEDFKAIVEKHMTAAMDLDGNHKMNWFFDQYVYGGGIPQYNFSYALDAGPNGRSHLKGRLHRAGVPDGWKDVIPLYAHVGDKTVRIGALRASHTDEDLDFDLPGRVDKVSIADFVDILADIKQ